ncbi:B12-binding domain-containing radical SAM protein [Anaerovorax odorimutans]|uniref:B12-binding domain-containing radical SAM protein n=1 Tax=Anaerovorax odorimutans TaxID=109327 RepID=UPI0004274B42|nr:B12-binding domain-containing radical SAM protein [Anaerovorax odorimutans]
MKILLTTLNAKYIHSNLALKYLYTSVIENKETISIREFTINNSDDYIFTELCREEYEVVCFSCYIWNTQRILYLAENLKKAKPEVKILFGGPEVSFDSVNIMTENKFVDFIISGEGELAFKQFLNNYFSDEPNYENINGLTYRLGDEICISSPPKLLEFDKVPFPYEYLEPESDKVVYYESTRGCPYRCSYCLSSIDKTVRALPVDRVYRELKFFIDRNVKQVKFIDRTFNWNKERCLEILRFLIVNDNKITNFHFELCGDLIDEKLIELLKSARDGLFQFEIGVQSTNNKTLEACNRKCNFTKLKNNIEQILNMGNIHLHLDLIAGLPYEDYNSFKESFNSVYALSAPQIQLGFLKLLKGAAIRGQTDLYKYEYRRKEPYEIISNQFLSALEVTHLKMIENVLDLYYNRGGFEFSIKFAMKILNENPFDFYERFSNYYYKMGFQHKSHKKEDLYRIFLQYIRWRENLHELFSSKMQEILKEDMRRTLNEDAIKKFERKGWDIL